MFRLFVWIVSTLLASATLAHADSIILRDGTRIEGTIISVYVVSDGTQRYIAVSDIAQLEWQGKVETLGQAQAQPATNTKQVATSQPAGGSKIKKQNSTTAPATTTQPAATATTQPATSQPSDRVIHVKGYTRKDGTYVAPHTRRAPAPRR